MMIPKLDEDDEEDDEDVDLLPKPSFSLTLVEMDLLELDLLPLELDPKDLLLDPELLDLDLLIRLPQFTIYNTKMFLFSFIFIA